tara:strand:- start:103 stop:531 length:429 start_codon:yes stop_codon:yes gene_type:complete
MSVGRIFRETRQGSINNSRGSKYDYEKIGRAKCYSHGAKGFYRDRNESSCNTLKNAGCVWKTDEKGGFCDLPKENSEKMEEYLNKSKEERKALKSAPPPEDEEAALKKKKRSKRRRKSKKRKPTKPKKSKRRRRRKHTRKSK